MFRGRPGLADASAEGKKGEEGEEGGRGRRLAEEAHRLDVETWNDT